MKTDRRMFLIAVSLALLVLSDGASAEDKKVSGTAKFGPTLSQTMFLPGDAPKHEVMLVNRIQFWNSANLDWNNVEVTQFSYTDYTAGGISQRLQRQCPSWR